MYYVSNAEHQAVLAGEVEGVVYPDDFKDVLLLLCHHKNVQNQMNESVKRSVLRLDLLLVGDVMMKGGADSNSNEVSSSRATSWEKITARLAGEVRKMGLDMVQDPFDDHVGRMESLEEPFTNDPKV